jgi:hypothetical protein
LFDTSESISDRQLAYTNIGRWSTAQGNSIIDQGNNSLFVNPNGSFSYRQSAYITILRLTFSAAAAVNDVIK